MRIYEIITVNELTFYFKLDHDNIQNDYIPHIWSRHLVEVYTAVTAYLNKNKTIYNKQHKRFEAYSKTDDITLYYAFMNKEKNKILIITAIRGNEI